MQLHCISTQLEFGGFDGHKVVAGFDGGAITSDAGALLLRHVNKVIGLFERMAACFVDAALRLARSLELFSRQALRQMLAHAARTADE